MSNYYEGKKIFVTGGSTGFLGKNFAEQLSRFGAKVSVNCAKNPFLTADFCDRFNLRDFGSLDFTLGVNHGEFMGQDMVIHCASFTGGAQLIKDNPEKLTYNNLLMSANVLQSAAYYGVKKFMFISSSAVYPDLNHPLSEDEGFVGDPHPVFFGIGWMKRSLEKLAEFYYKQYGMEVLIVRPSNVYGKYMHFEQEKSHVIAALICRFLTETYPINVWGPPTVVRDFIYINDFINNALSVFEQFKQFDTVNIVSGKTTTMENLASIISDCTVDYCRNIKTFIFDETKPVTVPYRALNSDYASTTYGCNCEHTLVNGLAKTMLWYIEHYPVKIV